jgi:hypothetical protein
MKRSTAVKIIYMLTMLLTLAATVCAKAGGIAAKG